MCVYVYVRERDAHAGKVFMPCQPCSCAAQSYLFVFVYGDM